MSGKKAKAARKRYPSGQSNWSGLDRRMFADDVDWVYSIATAAQESEAGPALGVAHLSTFARVTYEGLELLRRQRPTDAIAIELKHRQTVAAARHSVKLLDDTAKTLPSALEELEGIQADHQDHFKNSLLSVITFNGRLISSSRVSSYQTTWPLAETVTVAGKAAPHYDLTYEMGATVARIAAIFGHVPQSTELPAIRSMRPKLDDVESFHFAAMHYGEGLSVAEADLLSLVEAAINSALFSLEPAAGAFPNSVFRARFVALTHACNTIVQLLERRSSALKNGKQLAQLVESQQTEMLMSLRTLRNRCMHYGAPTALSGLSYEAPGYGLVESTSPGYGFVQVERALVATLNQASDAFGEVGL